MIRVPRDWTAAGDRRPAFSNTFPEILSPWVRDADFRRLIEPLNARLRDAFEPAGWRAWLDAAMGVLTGWLWEDLGLHRGKAAVRALEEIVETWNRERVLEARNSGAPPEEVVRCVELRRTGFLCLDFVIPDPKVSVVGEGEAEENVAGGADTATERNTVGRSDRDADGSVDTHRTPVPREKVRPQPAEQQTHQRHGSDPQSHAATEPRTDAGVTDAGAPLRGDLTPARTPPGISATSGAVELEGKEVGSRVELEA